MGPALLSVKWRLGKRDHQALKGPPRASVWPPHFRSVLFNLQTVGDFSCYCFVMDSNFILLWLGNIFCRISILELG